MGATSARARLSDVRHARLMCARLAPLPLFPAFQTVGNAMAVHAGAVEGQAADAEMAARNSDTQSHEIPAGYFQDLSTIDNAGPLYQPAGLSPPPVWVAYMVGA